MENSELKICTKCGIAQEHNSYTKDKQKKDGLRSSCKTCAKEYNPIQLIAHRKWKNANRDMLNASRRAKRAEIPHNLRYSDADKARDKARHARNRDSILAKRRAQYAELSVEDKAAYAKECAAWAAANPEKIRETKRKYKIKKRAESPAFVLAERISKRLREALNSKNFTKKGKTVDILGCTFEEFRIHIEKQFFGGMCWERIKEIDLDHIIPISVAATEQEVLRLSHFSNFQPLWEKINLEKSDKIGYELGNPNSGVSYRKIRAQAKLAEEKAQKPLAFPAQVN